MDGGEKEMASVAEKGLRRIIIKNPPTFLGCKKSERSEFLFCSRRLVPLSFRSPQRNLFDITAAPFYRGTRREQRGLFSMLPASVVSPSF